MRSVCCDRFHMDFLEMLIFDEEEPNVHVVLEVSLMSVCVVLFLFFAFGTCH